MAIIACANQKGGVGKTTTAVSLAHGLALAGKRALLVDLDPQGQVATLLGVKQSPGVYDFLVSSRIDYHQVVDESGRPGLSLIPGDRQTATAQVVIREKPINYLRDKIQPAIKGGFDYVIFDTAPSVGDIQGQAIYASDYLLIPSACDFLSSEGVFQLLDTANKIKTAYDWRGELLGIVPTFYDSTTKETQATLDDLRRHFTDGVLSPIHRATILRECAAVGQTIFELDPESRAAGEYQAIVDRVLRVAR